MCSLSTKCVSCKKAICTLSFLRKLNIFFCFIGWWMPFTLNVQNLMLFIPDIYHILLVSLRDTVFLVGLWASTLSDPSLPSLCIDFLLVMKNRSQHLTTLINKKQLKHTHTCCNINHSIGCMGGLLISNVFLSYLTSKQTVVG